MLDREAFRVAMRQWVTGVTMVSSAHAGAFHGMTVNSFTSISLDPPLLLVSLARTTRTHALVYSSGVFGVTILNEQQQDISDRFAGRTPDDEDRFGGLETFTLDTGAPFLAGGLACFDCEVQSAYPVGDHTLFVGRVVAIQVTPDDLAGDGDLLPGDAPLVYYNRAYHKLAGLP